MMWVNAKWQFMFMLFLYNSQCSLSSLEFIVKLQWHYLETPQFGDHIEMLQFAYNSVKASGRLEDGLNLVRSQKCMAFDYQFCTQEGL